MVDDDVEELTLIEEALVNAGQIVHYEENGVEALNYLNSCQELPALIVLDLNMPKLNGIETLQQLKADDRYNNINVIIYSTSANGSDKEKCLNSGAHSYIVKPSSYADTISTARYFSRLCAIE